MTKIEKMIKDYAGQSEEISTEKRIKRLKIACSRLIGQIGFMIKTELPLAAI